MTATATRSWCSGGSLALPAVNSSQNTYASSITYTSGGEVPLLALDLTDIRVVHFSTTRAGNTFTFSLIYRKDYAGRTLAYSIFTIPSAIGGAGGIVQLFNPAGQLVFDSNMKYMRVKGFYASGPGTDANPAVLGSDLDAGRAYGIIQSVVPFMNQSIYRDPVDRTTKIYFNATNMFWRVSNQLQSGSISTYSAVNDADGPPYVHNVDKGVALVIDITNF